MPAVLDIYDHVIELPGLRIPVELNEVVCGLGLCAVIMHVGQWLREVFASVL